MSKDWFIEIVVDTNDADYITSITVVADSVLKDFKKALDVTLKHFPKLQGFSESEYRETWMDKINNDHPDYEELCYFSDFIDGGEYGFHTVESVRIYPYVNKIDLI